MARRQHGTSQRHNHLQTVLASGLAVEEDLLWGWRENKEQLCKLYGATLWEMPFLFPTGKCAGRCFQRELGADTVPRKACRAELSWPGSWCQALADGQALLSEAQMTWLLCEPGDEGSFLGLHGLICLLPFPHQHICHMTSIGNVNTDCVALPFRTPPTLSPLPSGRVHAAHT